MADAQVVFNAAADYERYMGRWSRAVGEQFLAWLDAPSRARWLDIGCGTGAFSALILRRCAPVSVTGIDPAPAQIDYAHSAVPGATFEVADSMDMPFADASFDVAASALVLHFIPDRAKAFAEMRRVTRPGGLVAGYTWERTATEEYAPYVPMVRGIERIGGEAIRSPLVPEANPDGLRASLGAAGYRDIVVTRIEVSQTFGDFDHYWEEQTLSVSPPGRSVAKLDDAQRERLRAHMRASLPTAADGSIAYASRAVAFKART